MNNLRKLLCLILAVSTILSCSVTAFADDAEGENVLLTAPAGDAETPAEDTATEETPAEETEPDITDFEKVSDEEALATMEKMAENATLELYVATKDPNF